MIKLLIGVLVLLLGIPIGNILAMKTNNELKAGQKWFKIITIISLAGGIVGLIISNDVLLFTMFFIAVVVSRNIRKGKYKK